FHLSVCAIVEYEYAAKEPDELDLHKGAIIHRIKQMPGGWWQGTLKSTGTTGMFPDNFVRIMDNSISSNVNGNGSGDHSDEGTAVQLRDKSATSNRRCKVIYSYTQVNDDELTLAVGDVIEFLGEVEEGWWRGRLRTKVGVFPSNFVQHIEPSPILASKRPPTIGATVTTSSLTAKAANVANNTTATGGAGAAGPGTGTGAGAGAPITTTKQVTKSRAITAPAEPAAISSGALGTGTGGASASVGTGGSGVPVVPMLPPKPQREFCRVEFPYAPQNDDELELKVDDIITVITTELPDKGWWKGEIRGKVGVFPDNFVKMLAPSEGDAASPPPPRPRARARTGVASGMVSGMADGAGVRTPPRTRPQRGGSFEFLGARMASFITTIFAPINEPATQATQRKIGNISNISNSTASHMTTTNSSNSNSSTTTTVTTQQKEQRDQQIGGTSSTTSKVYIKKTGSSSNSTTSSSTTTASSAGRKESFGSRDSLNDILSETGLPTGNVAAQRKSLENKNLDLTKPPGVGAVVAISQQRSSTNSSTSTTSTVVGAGGMISSVSKSMENMDEKVKSPPPPVLSKKPSVPLKKTPTGGVPVAGNLLGGKKNKPDGKLTSAVSHDLADGLSASKMLTGSNQLPDAGAPGNLVMRRAATIAVEDTDFDRVERASILTDMRQGRVKAPKRRPPSAAINVLGESNNNSVYVNGSGTGGGGAGGAGSASELSEDGGKPGATASSDDNSTGEEPQLAKPKPREWEKKKAPWMEELKASQVTRKKTSPSVEPRGASVAERTSKLFAADQAISSSMSSSSTTTKVQSSAVTSSMYVENSSQVTTSSSSTTNSTTANDAIMSRSLSAAKAAASASSDEETRATRPNSLAIRNQRSVSPLVKSSNASASSSQSQEDKDKEKEKDKPAKQLNNHHQDSGSSATRVQHLEQRVEKLETVVQNQQRTIEELVNALKSEAERVKILRSELDKYAQCVTQV
ncbi:hypothetical protein KR009_009348, partial [Drosophila setifemur]